MYNADGDGDISIDDLFGMLFNANFRIASIAVLQPQIFIDLSKIQLFYLSSYCQCIIK